MTDKQCPQCLEVKPASDFTTRGGKPDPSKFWCRRCRHKVHQTRYENRKREEGSLADMRRDAKLKREYGVDSITFDAMMLSQHNACAICLEPFESKVAVRVDHCHETGKVRGLLCNNCNAGIGMLKDAPSIVARALQYLKEN